MVGKKDTVDLGGKKIGSETPQHVDRAATCGSCSVGPCRRASFVANAFKGSGTNSGGTLRLSRTYHDRNST